MSPTRRTTKGETGRILYAALVFGVFGTVHRAHSQAAPSFLQTRGGSTLNVHEVSLLANAPLGNLDAIEGAISRGLM